MQFNRTNDVNFGDIKNYRYQMQLYLSDYLFYSIINSLYYPDIYLMNATIPGMTTTTLNIALLGKLKKAGFENGNPCIVKFNAIGATPEIDITEALGLAM